MFDDELERLFARASRPFFDPAELLGETARGSCCGYVVSVGPDGRPVVREYGNAGSGEAGDGGREPLVETILDEKTRTVKLVAEMPGVEKQDVRITVDGNVVDIAAERGLKKYHAQMPVAHRIEADSGKASYKNGILELVFGLAEPEKPKGKTVEVS